MKKIEPYVIDSALAFVIKLKEVGFFDENYTRRIQKEIINENKEVVELIRKNFYCINNIYDAKTGKFDITTSLNEQTYHDCIMKLKVMEAKLTFLC